MPGDRGRIREHPPAAAEMHEWESGRGQRLSTFPECARTPERNRDRAWRQPVWEHASQKMFGELEIPPKNFRERLTVAPALLSTITAARRVWARLRSEERELRVLRAVLFGCWFGCLQWLGSLSGGRGLGSQARHSPFWGLGRGGGPQWPALPPRRKAAIPQMTAPWDSPEIRPDLTPSTWRLSA
jgi:hypothetical protein